MFKLFWSACKALSDFVRKLDNIADAEAKTQLENFLVRM
jgi:hypothetical protein